MKKVCSIVGARPQFIKACPLSKELRKHFNEILVHTGQHYDSLMSDIFFTSLEIPKPDYQLNIGSGTHGKQTGTMISLIEEVLIRESPDTVIVYGDTNSTLAGALAAVKLHIPVAHIESGLRSYNMLMPEEINRILVDRISKWLFVPSETSINNLLKEGICKNVYNVGDIMYDSLLLFIKLARNINPGTKCQENFILATIHRAENTDDEQRLKEIFKIMGSIKKNIILPLHPRTKQRLQSFRIKISENIEITNPLGYLEMLNLLQKATAVLTDSGGVQKEAYYLKVPCVTLREETEWTETVDTGWNILAGICKTKIVEAINEINEIKKMPYKDLYGSGNTAKEICEVLLRN